MRSLNTQIQLYAISVTTLWIYDYFLTVGDEVVDFINDDSTEGNLTTLRRSATHGKQRTLSVRESHTFRGVVLTGNVLVFTLFLFVGTLHPWHHIYPDRRLDQISSSTVPIVGWCW